MPPDPVATAPVATGIAPRSAHVALDRTTVPRYGDRIELSAAPHLVLVVGAADTRPAAPEPRDHDRLRVLADADDAGPVLDAELAGLTTGWRLLVVGAERDAQTVRAAALGRGALDAEITVHALDVPAGDIEGTRLRRIFCGHCHHRFDARAAVGDAVGCPGCDTTLGVAAHHSARHGAFLGAPRC